MKKEIIENLISIQQKELSALAYDFSTSDLGLNYSIPHHPYAGDLGVFGRGSIFQMLTRTVTQGGSKELANQLLNLELGKATVDLRQKSIQELADKTEWQHQFRANFKDTKGEKDISFTSVEVFPNLFYKVLFTYYP